MLPENTRRQDNPAKTSLRNSFFCSLHCWVWSWPNLFAFIFKVYFCNLLIYCKKNARGGIPALTMRNKNTPIKSHLDLACLPAQQGWSRTALQSRRAAPFHPIEGGLLQKGCHEQPLTAPHTVIVFKTLLGRGQSSHQVHADMASDVTLTCLVLNFSSTCKNYIKW